MKNIKNILLKYQQSKNVYNFSDCELLTLFACSISLHSTAPPLICDAINIINYFKRKHFIDISYIIHMSFGYDISNLIESIFISRVKTDHMICEIFRRLEHLDINTTNELKELNLLQTIIL